MGSTLDELSFYCRQENPVGTLMLFGESGCGKTYLIDKELQEELKSSHFIVRVSLFGINSIDALHIAIKRQWLYICMPYLVRHKTQGEASERGRSFFKAVTSVLNMISPHMERFSNALQNPLELLVITPVVKDRRTKEKKKVVLVFDDADRTNLNWMTLLGAINDYCENKDFNTIIIANLEFYSELDAETASMVRAAKEKAIAYTVLNCPDYERIVHEVIWNRSWKTQEYGEFLREHEQLILDLFASVPLEAENGSNEIVKHHNVRGLITALESFHRVYHHMTKARIPDISPYLYSFVSFYLVVKTGFFKNKKPCYTYTDKDVCRLYPRFSSDTLFRSVRHWIEFSYWDEELFSQEIVRHQLC